MVQGQVVFLGLGGCGIGQDPGQRELATGADTCEQAGEQEINRVGRNALLLLVADAVVVSRSTLVDPVGEHGRAEELRDDAVLRCDSPKSETPHLVLESVDVLVDLLRRDRSAGLGQLV
eukprot:8374523-Pyramimonas_sp.AAC.1